MKNKSRSFLQLIAGILVFFLITSCFISGSSEPAPSWGGITPGQTTPEEVEALRGKPDEILWFGNDRVYEYHDLSKSRPESFFFQAICNCVTEFHIDLLMRRGVDDLMRLQEVLDTYGEPEAVTVAGMYPGRTVAFIYATKGIVFAVQANRPAEEAFVYAQFYYVPMSLDLFMGSYAKDWQRDVNLWDQYEYND